MLVCVCIPASFPVPQIHQHPAQDKAVTEDGQKETQPIQGENAIEA